MLLIRASAKKSPVHGIGLFADEPIAAGTVLWRFDPSFDRAFSHEQICSLPQLARLFVGKHGYLSQSTGRWILPVGDDRFWNHSNSPNCESRNEHGGEGTTVAISDIVSGEELTENYNNFNPFGLLQDDFDPATVVDPALYAAWIDGGLYMTAPRYRELANWLRNETSLLIRADADCRRTERASDIGAAMSQAAAALITQGEGIERRAWRDIATAPPMAGAFEAIDAGWEIRRCWRHNPSSNTDEILTYKGNRPFKATHWRPLDLPQPISEGDGT